MHPAKFFFYFLIFMLVTSREVLWLRVFFDNSAFNGILAGLFVLFLISLMGSFNEATSELKTTPILRWRKWRGQFFVFLSVFVIATYMLYQQAIRMENFIPLKHSAYFLLLPFFFSENFNVKDTARVFVLFCVLTSIAIAAQFVLLNLFYGEDLSSFAIIPNSSVDGRTDSEYVNPFYLGFIRKSGLVDYGLFQFYRACAFTTEPKYCSGVLLSGIACLFFVYPRKTAQRTLMLTLLSIGVFVSHAYSSLGILFVAFITSLIGRSRFSLLSLIAMIWVVYYSYTFLLSIEVGADSFAMRRIESFATANSTLENTSLSMFTLVGNGYSDGQDVIRNVPAVFKTAIRYGWVGLVLIACFVGYVFKMGLKCIRETKSSPLRTSLALCIAILIVHIFLLSNEYITPLFCFLISIIFRISLQEGTISVPRLAQHYSTPKWQPI